MFGIFSIYYSIFPVYTKYVMDSNKIIALDQYKSLILLINRLRDIPLIWWFWSDDFFNFLTWHMESYLWDYLWDCSTWQSFNKKVWPTNSKIEVSSYFEHDFIPADFFQKIFFHIERGSLFIKIQKISLSGILRKLHIIHTYIEQVLHQIFITYNDKMHTPRCWHAEKQKTTARFAFLYQFSL